MKTSFALLAAFGSAVPAAAQTTNEVTVSADAAIQVAQAALARAITPVLAERATAGYLPLLAVLFAAIAIAIDHMNRTGLRAEER